MQKKDRQGATKKTVRRLAVECLVRWDLKKQALQPLLEQVVYQEDLDPRDRHLAVMLIQGVLRQLQSLDGVIAGYSRFPVKKMKPLTIMALRVGVFQLLFLDRIPDSAAVNETVKVLKQERQPRWLVSFVNGVLRSVARNKSALIKSARQPAGENTFNHPKWLVRRWQSAFGEDRAGAICQANNREPERILRVNTLQTTSAVLTEALQGRGHGVRPGQYAPDSLVLESVSDPLAALPGYEEGLFHVQDEAAQLVTMLLAPFEEGVGYLDACAGLGGKTLHLAQMVSAEDLVTAVEPSEHRIQMLEQNIQRLRLATRVRKYHGSLEDFAAENPEPFGRILVDAPCSGTGVIGRHPDIRWNRQPEDLLVYQAQQIDLLHQAASLLAPGGILVYVTCSLEPEENQRVIEMFLREHGDFSISNACDFLPDAATDLVDKAGYFCPTPADGLDGFFAARLVRNV